MSKEKKYIQNIRKIVGKAINRYGQIAANDKILVAFSGGKDSLVLLETLADRRKYLPIDYEIMACHIKVKDISYEIDHEYVQTFCDRLKVPFYIEEVIADDIINSSKSVCFLCSWHRRKSLFKKCSELNCNKLAFGHHMDDAIETLLMNMVYNGNISSMPPKLSMFEDEFDIIRPLILLSEKEIQKYTKIREFIVQKKECEYSDKSKRDDMKKTIKDFERHWKRARKNLWRSMYNIHKDFLPKE